MIEDKTGLGERYQQNKQDANTILSQVLLVVFTLQCCKAHAHFAVEEVSMRNFIPRFKTTTLKCVIERVKGITNTDSTKFRSLASVFFIISARLFAGSVGIMGEEKPLLSLDNFESPGNINSQYILTSPVSLRVSEKWMWVDKVQ